MGIIKERIINIGSICFKVVFLKDDTNPTAQCSRGDKCLIVVCDLSGEGSVIHCNLASNGLPEFKFENLIKLLSEED